MNNFTGILLEYASVHEAQHSLEAQCKNVNELIDVLVGLTDIVGDAWKGDDAEQFPIDLNRKLISALSGFSTDLTSLVSRISSGIDEVERADNQSVRLLNDLGDTIQAIY